MGYRGAVSVSSRARVWSKAVRRRLFCIIKVAVLRFATRLSTSSRSPAPSAPRCCVVGQRLQPLLRGAVVCPTPAVYQFTSFINIGQINKAITRRYYEKGPARRGLDSGLDRGNRLGVPACSAQNSRGDHRRADHGDPGNHPDGNPRSCPDGNGH